jgi:hypothetical protein
MRAALLTLFVALLAACGQAASTPPPATVDGGPTDAGPTDGGPTDGGPTDGGPTDVSTDVGLAIDSTMPDAAPPADTASTADGAGADAGFDTAAATDVALSEGQCTDDQPCQANGAFCKPAGSWSGCGMCQNVEVGCSSDAECKDLPNGICTFKQEDCTCSGTPLCHAGCALDKDCAEGEACAVDHRCQPKSCKLASDCPPLFACAADGQACQRQSCGKSSDCGGGAYCIQGKCYAVPGNCDFPKP